MEESPLISFNIVSQSVSFFQSSKLEIFARVFDLTIVHLNFHLAIKLPEARVSQTKTCHTLPSGVDSR